MGEDRGPVEVLRPGLERRFESGQSRAEAVAAIDEKVSEAQGVCQRFLEAVR